MLEPVGVNKRMRQKKERLMSRQLAHDGLLLLRFSSLLVSL